MSKGSWRRPRQIDHEAFVKAWEKIFGDDAEGGQRGIDSLRETARVNRQAEAKGGNDTAPTPDEGD